MACELVEHQQTSVQDVETSLRRKRLALRPRKNGTDRKSRAGQG